MSAAWGAKAAQSKSSVDITKAVGYEMPAQTFTYTEKDLITYALGVGAGAPDQTADAALKFTFENHESFAALPTYGVIPPFFAISEVVNVPGLEFNPMHLLHGETELVLHKPLPPAATLTNKARVAAVYDKKKGASVVLNVTTTDEAGDLVCTNIYTLFIRGLGGFGGPSGPATATPTPAVPARAPDFVQEDSTEVWQALLYRLSGDTNPLHADPAMAAMGGFSKPILHGLCTFGFAGRAVLAACCGNDPARLKGIKVRFARPVVPGERLRTEIWALGDGTAVFQTRSVQQGGAVVLSAGVATVAPAAVVAGQEVKGLQAKL